MTTSPRIAYAGMTHLGLCSAVAAASKGFSTLCFDPDAALVARLNDGDLPIVEPGVEELLHENRLRIGFSSDRAQLADCDVIYVAPDVPTDDAAQSDITGLDLLLDDVRRNVSPDAVMVVLSQVPPGFTRARQQPGQQVLYQVETLVFGRAMERAIAPERIIVGCPDPSEPLPESLGAFLGSFECPILPMRFESAELTKVAINCCLVASISVANTLAELCERIGGDWGEIAPALKLDKRIGDYAYLTPGLGIAGGNLERDLATVIKLSKEFGTDCGVIQAFGANSAHRKDWVLRKLHETVLDGAVSATVGILGLAYKENTHSVKNSPSLALIRYLAPWPIRVFDPIIPGDVVNHPNVTAATSAIDAARDVDALAIMTPWPEFRRLRCRDLAAIMRGRVVLDPYHALDSVAARAAGLDYRTLGVS